MTENKRFIYFFDDFNDIRRYKEGTDNDFAEVISILDLIEDANKLSEENKELKVELHKIYKLATVNKVRDIVDEVYDDLLYETTDESDYARKKVLECLEKLDEFGDELE